MQEFNNKTILISPLDWGLGHTTRCITIIRLLIDNNCLIIVACNSTQKKLLQQEFKDLSSITFLHLEGYNIKYSKKQWSLPLKLIIQLPKIAKSIIKEHIWLQKVVRKNKINLIISDNRYGFYVKHVTSVFITHQLTIKAPFLWLENLLQKINYSYINRFTQCWVPDYKGDKNIAGLLSHPQRMPKILVEYIGPLARFIKDDSVVQTYSFCIILSGPEPQRTVLEGLILNQLAAINEPCLLVRGKVQGENLTTYLPNVTIKNHLNGKDLQDAILGSQYIITRSGYTSVMELLALQKKSILIPTPEQTEQEYLGKQLMQQHWAFCIDQKDFYLDKAIAAAKDFNYQMPVNEAPDLSSTIANFLKSL